MVACGEYLKLLGKSIQLEAAQLPNIWLLRLKILPEIRGRAGGWCTLGTLTFRQLTFIEQTVAEVPPGIRGRAGEWSALGTLTFRWQLSLKVPPGIRGKAGGWSAQSPAAQHGARAGAAAPALPAPPPQAPWAACMRRCAV
eukprot:1160350-Pelagomonas_calceolata.AAC.4